MPRYPDMPYHICSNKIPNSIYLISFTPQKAYKAWAVHSCLAFEDFKNFGVWENVFEKIWENVKMWEYGKMCL